jgi:hypothetical protein
VEYNATDVFHQLLQDTLNALAGTGLILTPTRAVVTESGNHPNGTPLEFAETGQALQWQTPAGSTDGVATNPFLVSGNQVTLQPGALAGYATGRNRGFPALYSGSMQDVTLQGQFTFNPTGTNLITNPDFETNTTGWTAYDTGTVLAHDTTHARYNSAAMKLTPGGSTQGSRASWSLTTAPSTPYTFSAWVYPTSTRQTWIAMDGFSSGSVFTGTIAFAAAPLVANTWQRILVSGTAPASGTASVSFNVGFMSVSGHTPNTEFMWVDGAMVQTGLVLNQFVDSTGYCPDDYFTGLMVKSYLAKSVVGGSTVATSQGYLMGRRNVYIMSGKSITSTLTSLSTTANSGDVMGVKVSGTAITFTVNGSTVASITDGLYTSRVKCGFRVTESTSAYNFAAYPTFT